MEKTQREARKRAREGKRPTTQAGAYVGEQMHKLKHGQGTARSRSQAIAIGLSEARRQGVKVGGKGSSATRRKARRDTEIGQGRRRPSATRSRAGQKAAAARRARMGRKPRR